MNKKEIIADFLASKGLGEMQIQDVTSTYINSVNKKNELKKELQDLIRKNCSLISAGEGKNTLYYNVLEGLKNVYNTVYAKLLNDITEVITSESTNVNNELAGKAVIDVLMNKYSNDPIAIKALQSAISESEEDKDVSNFLNKTIADAINKKRDNKITNQLLKDSVIKFSEEYKNNLMLNWLSKNLFNQNPNITNFCNSYGYDYNHVCTLFYKVKNCWEKIINTNLPLDSVVEDLRNDFKDLGPLKREFLERFNNLYNGSANQIIGFLKGIYEAISSKYKNPSSMLEKFLQDVNLAVSESNKNLNEVHNHYIQNLDGIIRNFDDKFTQKINNGWFSKPKVELKKLNDQQMTYVITDGLTYHDILWQADIKADYANKSSEINVLFNNLFIDKGKNKSFSEFIDNELEIKRVEALEGLLLETGKSLVNDKNIVTPKLIKTIINKFKKSLTITDYSENFAEHLSANINGANNSNKTLKHVSFNDFRDKLYEVIKTRPEINTLNSDFNRVSEWVNDQGDISKINEGIKTKMSDYFTNKLKEYSIEINNGEYTKVRDKLKDLLIDNVLNNTNVPITDITNKAKKIVNPIFVKENLLDKIIKEINSEKEKLGNIDTKVLKEKLSSLTYNLLDTELDLTKINNYLSQVINPKYIKSNSLSNLLIKSVIGEPFDMLYDLRSKIFKGNDRSYINQEFKNAFIKFVEKYNNEYKEDCISIVNDVDVLLRINAENIKNVNVDLSKLQEIFSNNQVLVKPIMDINNNEYKNDNPIVTALRESLMSMNTIVRRTQELENMRSQFKMSSMLVKPPDINKPKKLKTDFDLEMFFNW